mgnify:CR=1 FL=1
MTPKGRRNAAVLFAALIGLSIILFNRSEASTLQTVYVQRVVMQDPTSRAEIVIGFSDTAGYPFIQLTSEDGTDSRLMTEWFNQVLQDGEVVSDKR